MVFLFLIKNNKCIYNEKKWIRWLCADVVTFLVAAHLTQNFAQSQTNHQLHLNLTRRKDLSDQSMPNVYITTLTAKCTLGLV